MEKFFEVVALPCDKANHAFLFTYVFVFLSLILAVFAGDVQASFVVIFVLTLAAAAKEFYDGTKDNHTRDINDFLASVLPMYSLEALFMFVNFIV